MTEKNEVQETEMPAVCTPSADNEEKRLLIPETSPFQIPYEMYRSAYKAYQRRFVYPKNRILQLILLLLSVDFAYHGAKNPEQPVSFVLLLVCLAMIGILWYNPRKMRRNVMDVVREMQGDRYCFQMDSEKVAFRMLPEVTDEENDPIPEQPPTELYYTKELYVAEQEEFFLICQGKQRFYILPKHALYDNQAEIVRRTFEEKLGRKFRSKI